MNKERHDTTQLCNAINEFLRHMDSLAWRDQGSPDYPSESWPYTILTKATAAAGHPYDGSPRNRRVRNEQG